MVSGKFDKLYNFIMENFDVMGYKYCARSKYDSKR